MYAALADENAEKAIKARLLFGEILQSLGRDGEAKSQFESALAAGEATTPNVAMIVARAKADLARVNDSLGAHAEGVRFRAKATTSPAFSGGSI